MKENTMLTLTSLLTIALGILHIADDVARGMSPGGLGNIAAIVIGIVWLYSTLLLAGRRSGYITLLVLSLLMVGVPVIHMMGHGMGFGTVRSNGVFFVWTVLALGVTAGFTAILAIRALIRIRKTG